VQGDATDPVVCREIRQHILAAHGRLDWLICSGTPSLQPLRIEAAAFERIDRFLRSGFALVLGPLTSSLDLLSESGGSVLLISSIFVEDPPTTWPHYVALKCAVEGLARVAAAEYRKVSFCIARPSKLKTDLVNTPMGRAKTEDPSVAALRILTEAARGARPGEVCYLK
jgi:NAD(P)-dependent dehydrogenase (short-subunit alcohol dehydrogenase family)